MAAPPISERHKPHFHRKGPVIEPVRVATTADLTIATALNAGDSIDGVTLAAGDRVLVKNQSTGSQNGIYVAGATPVRDYDQSTDDPGYGFLVNVLEGSTYAGTLWANTNTSAPTIGSTSLTFAQVSGGSGAPTGADYLVGTANGGLSAEIVVGTTPGGELGGTWASPTVDSTHSGSAHTDFIAKSLLTTQDDIIVRDGTGPARLAKGSDGQVLTVDPTTHHLVWATPSAGSGDVATDTIWNAKGDLAVGTGSNTASRLAVGSNGQVLTADSGEATGVKWATGGGGGGLAQSYLGYNTIGGTWTTMTAFRVLCKQVTFSGTTNLLSIDAYVRPSTDNLLASAAMLMADNAGAPGVLVAGAIIPANVHYLSNSASMPGAGRWYSWPVSGTFPAGTYWIAVVPNGTLWDIANDGSGSDQYFNPGAIYVTGAYPSAWAITTGSVKYSIRASVLT